MRVLITGSTGFVGRGLVRRLAMNGHDVVALHHDQAANFAAAAELRHGDMRDTASLRHAVADVDAVCHLAALTRARDSIREPLPYFDINTGGTLNLLTALAHRDRQETPRLVFLSTCAVYGQPDTQPITEETVPNPANPYGDSKLAAERAIEAQARTGALGAVIIRTFNAAGAVDSEGDRDLTRLIPKAIAVAAGQADTLRINGDGSVVREFIHIDDLASALTIALDACQPGTSRTYNAGSGIGVPLRDVVATVEDIAGTRLAIEHGPPAAEPHTLISDTTRIQAELGWKPARSDLRTIIEDAWNAATAGRR